MTQNAPEYVLKLDVISQGFDGKTCWVHPRAGAMPPNVVGNGAQGSVVMTMQKLLLSGSDIFFALNEMRTDDLGKTWTGPTEHAATLGRKKEANGIESVICDATPAWHTKTGKLLSTGHVARYLGDDLEPDPRKRTSAYSVYNAQERTWSTWDTVEMPSLDGRFYSCGSGSGQRYDLADGTILLPIYFKGLEESKNSWGTSYRAAVMRCAFDGKKLTYIEHGSELSVPTPRGLYEPSVIGFEGRYYLTMRNDKFGYVSVSDDGLNYSDPIVWHFDDGVELGNYNTQQHWVAHQSGLYLVYTRRGLNNDHVFRHRSPLLIAKVDTKTLRVIRETETILVPEKGTRIGNFAVANVNENETWVTVAEWMQPKGCEKYGSDNRVWAARICWTEANRLHPAHGAKK